MIPRPLSIRQVGIFLFLSLIIFIVIFLIIIESSEYVKCPSCSRLNTSSIQKIFDQILNNTEDEKTSIDDYSIWCLDMAHRLDSEQYFPKTPTLKVPSINSSKLHRFPYRYSVWKSSSLLPRRFTACEHNLAMRLIMIIERICRKNNLIFMLSDGSLLGSWRHHDIIPWDDDIDFLMPQENKTRFEEVLNSMNKTLIQYKFLSHSTSILKYFKIYFKHTPSAGGYSWNFPVVDVWLYVSNKTHLRVSKDPHSTIKHKHVFPLVMRPFGQLWLPSPQKPRKMFNFDPYDQCKGHNWDHRHETSLDEILRNCSELKDIYPFVQRDKKSSSIEILKTNYTILHTVIFN